MMHRDKIHKIKSFDDFTLVSQEIVENIRFSEKKLMLHKLALTYMLHPSRIIETLITDASARLFDKLMDWLCNTPRERE